MTCRIRFWFVLLACLALRVMPLRADVNSNLADRVFGQTNFTNGTTGLTDSRFNAPEDVQTDGTRLIVADGANNRVLIWPTFPTTDGAAATLVLGQTSFTVGTQGTSATKFVSPRGLFTDGTRLIVTENANNRAVLWTSFPTSNGQAADLVIGESNFTNSTGTTAANSTITPHGALVVGGKLIIGDSGNNRVLIFNSVPSTNGANADIVLGQPNFTTATSGTTAAKMSRPTQCATDGTRLLVCDSTNNRVLIYNTIPTSNSASANLVLGQTSFTVATAGTTASKLSGPRGVATDGTRVFVADETNNRVLVWNTFPTTNGQAADQVIGQASFTTATAAASQSGMNAPRGLCLKGGRLLVTDGNNDRVLYYNLGLSFGSLSAPAAVKGLSYTATVPVINNGFDAVNITSTSLTFSDPGVTATPSGGNPTTVAAGTTQTFTYTITAGASAIPGSITPTLTVNAKNSVSTADATKTAALSPLLTVVQSTSVATADAMLRQEKGLSTQASTPVTVTVANPSGTNQLRVDSVSLVFSVGASTRTSQYTVVNPSVPVSIPANGSATLTFQVTPSRRTTPFETVNITATLALTDLGTSSTGTTAVATSFSVSSVPLNYVGQVDGNTVGVLRNGFDTPERSWSNGTKLAVVDSDNNRVLIWNTFPTTTGQPPDLVLGQPDFRANTANNGGVSASSLFDPVGVTSDGTKLAVVDNNNHRVLVWTTFPASNFQAANIVLGQANFTSNLPNRGLGSALANRLNNPIAAAMTSTKLLVADVDNNRVLIWTAFPTTNGENADLVLGQSSFAGSAANNGGVGANTLSSPRGVSVSPSGRVAVADTNNNRVLLWTTFPTSIGQSATRVLGQESFTAVAVGDNSYQMNSPIDVWTDGTKFAVADHDNHRVLLWDSLPSTGAQATRVVGQSATTATVGPNRGADVPAANSLAGPDGVFYDGTHLIVADSLNERVLVYDSYPSANLQSADIVLGQNVFTSAVRGGIDAAKLRPVWGVATDGTHLAVADSSNNRVLLWNSLPTSSNQAADLVLGQSNFISYGANRFSGTVAAANRLSAPRGVCIDSSGRLIVADEDNNRVLVWTTFPISNGQSANLVLGQTTFSGSASGLTNATLNAPTGVFSDGTRLVVGDSLNHRVLIWPSFPTSNGQAATRVVGQTNFTSGSANQGGTAAANKLHNPRGVWTDGTKFVVADAGNHRVLIWTTFPTANNVSADLVLGQPNFIASSSNQGGTPGAGTFASPAVPFVSGGRLYVADSLNDRVLIWNTFPSANGQPATGILGKTSFTDGIDNPDVSPTNTDAPIGLAASGTTLWMVDNNFCRVQRLTTLAATAGPTVALTFSKGTNVNAGPLTITATFAQSIATTPTIAVAAPGTANDVATASLTATADPKIWTYVKTIASGDDGTVTVTIANGENADGETNQTATNNTFVIDTISPSSALSYSKSTAGVPIGPLTVTATFSEAIATTPKISFAAPGTANDVSNANMTATADPKIWTYAATIANDTDGSVTVTVTNASDAAGNAGAAATNDTFTIDASSPTVSLAYSKNQARVTEGDLRIYATFNEAVVSTPKLALDAPDVDNDIPATDMSPTLDPLVWVFTAVLSDGGPYNGIATVTITNARDAAGNSNLAASNNSFNIDGTGSVQPTCDLTYSKDATAVGIGSLRITATFAEDIVSTPQLAIFAPGADNDVTAQDMSPTADASVWYFDTTILAGAGNAGTATVFVTNAQNGAGTLAERASNEFFVIDVTRPSVALSYSKPPSSLGIGTVVVTATFTEDIVTTPVLAVLATGTDNDLAGANMSATADPKIWTYTYTIVADSSGDGPATVSITNGKDSAQNENDTATNASLTIDSLRPTVALTYDQSVSAVGLGALAITATFSESIVTTPKIAIAAPASVNDVAATSLTASADPKVWLYVATIAGGAGTSGSASVAISEGEDAVGNTNQAATNASFTIDSVAPAVALTYSKNQPGVSAGSLTVTATFDESVVTTPKITIAASGTSNDVNAVSMTSTADPEVWTYAATIVGGDDGPATIAITNGRDAADNENQAATNNTFTIDTTGPAVDLTYSKPSASVGPGALTITATFDEIVTTTPTIAIAAPNAANDVAATNMSPTATSQVWIYTTTIVSTVANDGLATVTIAGADDTAGNPNQPASGDTFTVDVAGNTATPSNTPSAPRVALRQEKGNPTVEPTPLTVTVANPSSTSQLRVDQIALAFAVGGASTTSQYTVTAPAVPVTISPSASQNLVFQVTPSRRAAVFGSVDITATVTATDLGNSVATATQVTTSLTVSPVPLSYLGQYDGTSLRNLRRGFGSPDRCWTDGTRLAITDSGNDRVLIWNTYPTSNYQAPDIVLGQPDFLSTGDNNGGISASTLSNPRGVASNGTAFAVSDSGNNRVLVWNTFPTANGQAADVVVGQTTFTGNLTNQGNASASSNRLDNPFGLAIIGTKLVVADDDNDRVLVFNSIPTSNGAAADLVLGQTGFTGNSPNQGGTAGAATMAGPVSVSGTSAMLAVADRGNNRVLVWTTFPTNNGASANRVLGQSTTSGTSPGTGSAGLSDPMDVATDGTAVAVVDGGNCRVMLWLSIPATNGAAADRVVGQSTFTSGTACNRGATVPTAATLCDPIGVVFDSSHFVIADANNSRVLLFSGFPAANGASADLALGQPSLVTRGIGGGVDASLVSGPRCLATDGTHFAAADRDASRVLIWNSIPTSTNQPADVVLGQADFSGDLPNRGLAAPTSGTLHSPKDVFFAGSKLVVADTGNHRVLIWNSIPTSNGQAASNVLGQAGFTTAATGLSSTAMNGPQGIGSDGTKLLIADKDNNRVMIWTTFPTSNNTAANRVIGQANLSTGTANTGGISLATVDGPENAWTDGTRVVVGDTDNNRVLLFNTFPASSGTAADLVLGQASGTSRLANRGGGIAANTLFSPRQVQLLGSRLYVSDTSNDRVLVWNTIPTSNGQAATGILGFTNFNSGTTTLPTAISMESDFGVVATGNHLFVSNSGFRRIQRLTTIAATAGPTVALTYSKGTSVNLGPLTITATFSQNVATVPTIAIAAPGTTNDVTATAMTATGDPKIWIYPATIVAGTDGSSTVTIANGENADGEANAAATNATFTIDATQPAVALTYSQNANAGSPGALTITATFNETPVGTPRIRIDAAGTDNDAGPVNMTATGDPKVWIYTTTVVGGAGTGGDATITIDNVTDAAGNGNDDATNAIFTIQRTGLEILSVQAPPFVRRLQPRIPVNLLIENPGFPAQWDPKLGIHVT